MFRSIEGVIKELQKLCKSDVIIGHSDECAGRQAEALLTEAIARIPGARYGHSETLSPADSNLGIDHWILLPQRSYGAYKGMLIPIQCKAGAVAADLPVVPKLILESCSFLEIFVYPVVVYVVGNPCSDYAVISTEHLIHQLNVSIENGYHRVQVAVSTK